MCGARQYLMKQKTTERAMPNSASTLQPNIDAASPSSATAVRLVPIVPLGMGLGLFLSLTFALCVLFDLWFPGYAMNAAWTPLLPGFTWISGTSFAIGLVETFAYGWYVALIFGPIYNFFAARTKPAILA
jgi:hypothetical protein